MHSPRLLPSLLLATAFMATACTNNQTTSSETDTAKAMSADTSVTNAAPASIAKTQNVLVVLHKVASFAKWKMAYDADDSARLSIGIHSYVIGRGLQDSNTVLVSMKVDDTAKAMAFGKSLHLKATMQKGGVMGTPKIGLAAMTFQDTAGTSSNLRSAVSFTVKDWDAWFKSFQEGAQQRLENGVAPRAYGHEIADNHKVRVVTALIDSAKAVAYFKSDTLKKRMQASGVVGQPERFLYRIAHRY